MSPACPWIQAGSCSPTLLTACPGCPSGNPLHHRHHSSSSSSSNPHSDHCSKFISRKEIKRCAITALITSSINTVLSVACPRVTTLEATFTASRAAPAPGWYRSALCRYEIFYRTQQLAAGSTVWQGKQPGMRESLSASPLKICPNLVVRNHQKNSRSCL